jgi:hypothetical protein
VPVATNVVGKLYDTYLNHRLNTTPGLRQQLAQMLESNEFDQYLENRENLPPPRILPPPQTDGS